MAQILNYGGKTYNQQSGETEQQLMARGRKGVADTAYTQTYTSYERAKAVSDAQAKSVATTGSELSNEQRKTVFNEYGGKAPVPSLSPTQLAAKYGFPQGSGVEMQTINGVPTPVLTSFNGKPLPLGTGNSDNGKVKVTTVQSPPADNSSISDGEREGYQKQINTLQEGVNSYRQAAETLRLTTLKSMKEQEQSLNTNFANLKTQLGNRFALVQNAIANVEAKTNREVSVNPDFAAKASELAGEKPNDADFQVAIGHLASSFAVDPKRDRFGQYYSTPEGQQFQAQNGNVNQTDQSGGAAIPGTAGANNPNAPAVIAGGIPAPTPTPTDAIVSYNPNKATGTTASLLSNPNATSEDILLSLYRDNNTTIDLNTTNVLEFLKSSNDRTRRSEEQYTALLEGNKASLVDFLNDEKDLIKAKYDLQGDQIAAEEVSTMGDLNSKRSRLEGYLKAKLKKEGVLDGSFGVNSYLSKITQYDTMIRNTKQGFDFKLRQNEVDRTTDMLSLADKLITINNEYAEKEFNFHFTSEGKIDDNILKGLQTVNEANIEKSKNFSDTTKEIVKLRQDRADAMAEALKDAQERADKNALDMTKNLGIVHTVDAGGNVVMLQDDNGDPILSWDRVKEQTDLELKGQQFTLDQQKQHFDEWYKSAAVSIDRAQANAQITKIQADIWRDNLKEGRDQQEFKWKQQEQTDKRGYAPSGEIQSAIINGRTLKLDSGALQSAQSMNQLLAPFGGLRIGAQEFSTTRDQAATIKAMAGRFGVKYNASNPNATAEQLRNAGHQIANVGESNHERGIAMDLFPDHGYINKVKPYLLANGWIQPMPDNDAGHFEFVGGKSSNIASWEKVEIGTFIGKVFNGRVSSPGVDQIKQFQTELETEWANAKAGGISLDDFLKQYTGQTPSGGSAEGAADTGTQEDGVTF